MPDLGVALLLGLTLLVALPSLLAGWLLVRAAPRPAPPKPRPPPRTPDPRAAWRHTTAA
jgi:hypothetical protein